MNYCGTTIISVVQKRNDCLTATLMTQTKEVVDNYLNLKDALYRICWKSFIWWQFVGII